MLSLSFNMNQFAKCCFPLLLLAFNNDKVLYFNKKDLEAGVFGWNFNQMPTDKVPLNGQLMWTVSLFTFKHFFIMIHRSRGMKWRHWFCHCFCHVVFFIYAGDWIFIYNAGYSLNDPWRIRCGWTGVLTCRKHKALIRRDRVRQRDDNA